MGQNIRTSLSQAVAEELHVPISTIRLVMGDTDLSPFDAGTFGSRTTPTMAPQLRKAAVAARETLIALAAQQWQVEPSTVRIVDARFVNHDTTKSLTLADLAKGLKLVKTIPADVKTTPPKEWTIAGQSIPKVDGRDFVTGRHMYTSDVRRDGMLFGKVVRPSAFNATLVSSDPPKANSGAQLVKDGDFIGVAASDQQTAIRVAGETNAQWKAVDQPGSSVLFDHLRKTGSS
jgi:isoquinoline 1-oxidoreductase